MNKNSLGNMKSLALPIIIVFTLISAPVHAHAFFDLGMFGFIAHADDDDDKNEDEAERLRTSARSLVGKLYERIEQRKESERVLERSRENISEGKAQSQFSSSLVQLNYARASLKSSQRTLADQRQYLLEYIGALISYDEYLRTQMEQLPYVDEDIFTSFTALVNADVATLREYETRVRTADSIEVMKTITKELLLQRQEFTQLHVRRLTVLAHIGVMQKQSLATLQERASEQMTAALAFAEAGVSMTGIIEKIEATQDFIDASGERLSALTASTTAATLSTKDLQQIHEALVRERSAHREIFDRILEIAKEARKLTKGE